MKSLRRTVLPVWLLLTACMGPALEPQQPAPSPRILILGDSISMGYTPVVRELLAGEAQVFRPMVDENSAENCAGTTKGVTELARWLAIDGGGFDVIHFNFGLHDLKRVHPETRANSNDPAHQRQAEPEVYRRQLAAIVAQLKATGATLILATTTPVPAGGVKPLRDVTDPPRYNAIAREVCGPDVMVDDLYAFALARLEEIQQPVNVHFTAEGSRQLGEEVTRVIREALRPRQR